MNPVLIDSCVLIDVLSNDPTWYEWSSAQLTGLIDAGSGVINQVIYAEACGSFDSPEEVDRAVRPDELRRVDLPWQAAFPASRAFRVYRRRGGTKTSPLPDFYIGAHAQVGGLKLLTRDVSRFRTYFPDVELICPE